MKASERALTGALAGRLLVVCGPGGVGKTTVSAALALQGAERGRRTLVCTIDPSRRLRTSLGLSRLTGKPQRVTDRLHAMRLDPKRTFDDLVRRHARNPEARDRILGNRFYQQISRHLAGTHEVMAMEALLGVAPEYDLIVLDTPPAGSALAFLDAPTRVRDFVDGRVLRYFLKPYFVAGRLAIEPRTMVGKTLLGALDSAVGLQFLRELSEFFLAFEGLFDSFRDTALAMEKMLRDEGTAFFLVTTPAASRVNEGAVFASALQARSLRAAATVVNRVHPWAIDGGPDLDRADPSSRLSAGVRTELVALAEREAARAAAEVKHMKAIGGRRGLPSIVVPELEQDVHDLKGLGRVAARLNPGETGG